MFTYLEELASVIITRVESEYATVNCNIGTNTKVSWHEWGSRIVALEHHLSLEEGTLWDSSVHRLWLSDLN